MRIYQAGPLFTEAEQQWHRTLKACLQAAGYDVVWPFELIAQQEVDNHGKEAARYIMETDKTALDGCDVMVALLDGPQVDDGTAWEIGYAHARSIPVIGIRTDFRRGGETANSRVNAMIEGSCLYLVSSRKEVLEALARITGTS